MGNLRNQTGHCEPVTDVTGVAIRAPTAVAIVKQFKVRLPRPSPMGKVAALVLTEEA